MTFEEAKSKAAQGFRATRAGWENQFFTCSDSDDPDSLVLNVRGEYTGAYEPSEEDRSATDWSAT